MMVFARLGIPEERTHLVEYGVVALLIYEALKERASQGRYAPALLATLSSSFLGVLDECIQAFLPNRLFDPRDIFFNVLAGVVVIFASMALSWVRKRMMQAPLNLFK
jgi:VanZ family protein